MGFYRDNGKMDGNYYILGYVGQVLGDQSNLEPTLGSYGGIWELLDLAELRNFCL